MSEKQSSTNTLCEACDGSGSTDPEDAYPENFPCPGCKGTGLVASPEAVEARWVAAGVGLPPCRRTAEGGWSVSRESVGLVSGVALDLTDPQTAFGVALKLDEWERAESALTREQWTSQMAAFWQMQAKGQTDILLDLLAARVTHIGQDHHIRRALGWEVEPGTLAVLERISSGNADDWWALTQPGGSLHHFTTDPGSIDGGFASITGVPTIAGVTDPAEALRIIAESM